MKAQVWIVMLSDGEYEDITFTPLCVYTNLTEASKHAVKANVLIEKYVEALNDKKIPKDYKNAWVPHHPIFAKIQVHTEISVDAFCDVEGPFELKNVIPKDE